MWVPNTLASEIYLCQNKCCLQHSCPTHPCGTHKSLYPQQNQHRATLRILPPHTSQGIYMDATPRGRRIRVLSSSEVGVAAGLHCVRFRVISGVHLLPHPPYSTSDLSPCNWFLFQYINKQPYTTVREFMRATTYRHFLWLVSFLSPSCHQHISLAGLLVLGFLFRSCSSLLS